MKKTTEAGTILIVQASFVGSNDRYARVVRLSDAEDDKENWVNERSCSFAGTTRSNSYNALNESLAPKQDLAVSHGVSKLSGHKGSLGRRMTRDKKMAHWSPFLFCNTVFSKVWFSKRTWADNNKDLENYFYFWIVNSLKKYRFYKSS